MSGGNVPAREVFAPKQPFGDRLEKSYLYLVTPARPAAGDLDDFLARVLGAGVDIVQLREKNMEAGPLLGFCEVARRRTEEFGALFIVNDRVDVALAAGADGVHVGQDDLPVAEVRRQMGPGMIVGLSTHSEQQFLAGLNADVDYLAVGPVFVTPTKPGRPAVGTELVAFAAGHRARPVFSIGGINRGNLGQVRRAGGSRVAVVRALTESADPSREVRDLAALLGASPP